MSSTDRFRIALLCVGLFTVMLGGELIHNGVGVYTFGVMALALFLVSFSYGE